MLLSLFLVGVLALATPRITPDSPGWLCDCDHLYYWQMSQGVQAPLPFGARVLKPTLTRLLPIPPDVATWLITVASLTALGPVVYRLSLRLGLAHGYALVGVAAVYGLPELTVGNLADVYRVDALAILWMTVGVYAAVNHRFTLFLVALLAGVLTKETAIIMLAVWWPYNPRLRPALMLAAPAVIVLMALRLAAPGAHNLLAQIGTINVWRQTHPLTLADLNPFGILPLLALVAPAGRRLLVCFAPFLALVYAQLLVASDTGRLLVYGFAPIVVAALLGARQIITGGLNGSTTA